MRLFVAVNLPAPVRAAIADAIEPFQRTIAHVRWAAPESLHVTLKFLGSVADAAVDTIQEALRTCAAAHAPAAIDIGGLGAFPDERRPRIFWVGVHDGGALGALARDLDAALAPLGFAPEARAFTPHITIGRARDRRGATPAPRADGLASGPAHISVRVETIDLMRSHTVRDGAHYERLYAARLGGEGK